MNNTLIAMNLLRLRSHAWLTPLSGRGLAVVALTLAIGGNSRTALATPPENYLAKLRGTPDLMQTLKKAEFRGEGKKFCAPVAVSNSLMWLGSHGYPNLLPEVQGGRTSSQIEMVHLLASEEMMNTGVKSGTGPKRLTRGLERYVESCGYSCSKLQYQGWRPVSKRHRHEQRTPDLEWIKSEFARERTAVWMNVGWYKAGKQTGEHERIGGHWVTLVGYRGGKQRSATVDVYVVHDPAPRAGKTFARENLVFERIESGTLVGTNSGLPHSAAGYHLVGGGMHIKKSADYGILDGVVVLELAPQ